MYGQIGSGISGTIAATTNGILYVLRYPEFRDANGRIYDPGTRLKIQRKHVQITTGTAFTTPVTLGRALRWVLARPTNGANAHVADPTGGREFAMVHKLEGDTETLAKGYISSTGALTTTGFSISPNPRQRINLSHMGASGSNYDEVWRFDGVEAEPIYLRPGQWFGLETEADGAAGALDAGGTLQINVDVDAIEVSADEVELP